MIASPGVALRIKHSPMFNVSGPHKERVEQFTAMISEQWQLPSLPELHIEVVSTPREHVGLGVGTQLALAVAAGLAEALGFAWRDPWHLAQLTRRGRRSAVGTYGFLQGGFIVDGGHHSNETLGQLTQHCHFPSAWQFVLFIPKSQVGCAGSAEERAFANLPSVPLGVTCELETITKGELIPAVEGVDFDRFSNALFRYGSLAGKCFASVQGGTFCSPQTTALIEWVRMQGITGVGQSSWGPTVFALLSNQTAAKNLAQLFAMYTDSIQYEVLITPAANSGADIRSGQIHQYC
jgi:beta-RFAP synthase